ncbi:MAG: hypothetical protein HYX89_01840 [Chloroflexi bacterium]|nr:hypothetical protein [Chloroflexota bacterium]
MESLLAADSEPPVEMDLSNPDLALIDGMANDLARAGFPAGAMFVPTSLPPEFYDLYYDRIEWEGHPRLQTPFGQMNIYWESELEHFILISHQAGVWQVVPDADTGEALTVAVGAERLYPDLIRIVGGTVAQFDVLEPRAFRTIRAVKGLKHLSSLTDRGVSARLA